jgi:hypothetical protein
MKARAKSPAAKPPCAILVYAPFVIKPVAVPPAEIFGLPYRSAQTKHEGLSGGKITVFSCRGAVLRCFGGRAQ